MGLLILLAGIAGAAEAGHGDISGVVLSSGQAPTTSSTETNHVVRDAIVYLAGLAVRGSKLGTNNEVIVDERDGKFVPQIQIARSGGLLILRNSDPTLHVVRIDSMSGTNSSKTLLKAAMPYAGYEKKCQLENFTEPTLLRITFGNGETGAPAYIAVMPHPWAALTDDQGRFTLRNVPDGEHKIYAWHEVFGTLAREVEVSGSRNSTIDFQFTTER
ncbi:MAG TPA: carboxypeptidase-like regulatory domain-containing protein [Verrucomicrobiae bacterium]|nr:carboxypeptidase-like regulatory domain-containing protein [Verrucomicrobiae bacterium]